MRKAAGDKTLAVNSEAALIRIVYGRVLFLLMGVMAVKLFREMLGFSDVRISPASVSPLSLSCFSLQLPPLTAAELKGLLFHKFKCSTRFA